MIVARRERWSGGALLVALMAVTLLPFASLFTTALHQSGTYPTVSTGRRTRTGATSSTRSTPPTWARSSVQRADRARRRAGLGPDRDDGRLRRSAICACAAAGSSSCSSCSV